MSHPRDGSASLLQLRHPLDAHYPGDGRRARFTASRPVFPFLALEVWGRHDLDGGGRVSAVDISLIFRHWLSGCR